MDEYKTDPAREAKHVTGTGMYVRAKSGITGAHMTFDIIELDRASLKLWLRSRGGDNPWAEEIVAILLGHMKEN